MIEVCFTKKDDHYVQLVIQGHAESDETGKDLICAAVSAIATGIANAFNGMLEENDMTMSDNRLELNVHAVNEKSDLMMETVWYQLETIRLSYKEYIKIDIVEE